jgi:histidine triad (HIT) family protein
VAHEDDLVVAFHDIAPKAPTHILLIPKRHIASAADLGEVDGPLLGRMFEVASRLAREAGVDRSGYRLVSNIGSAAGQSVPHLHIHLLGGRSLRLRRASATVLLVTALGAAACGRSLTPDADPGPPLPTPQASLSASIAATVAELRVALATAGFQLFPPQVPYRPSEPAGLTQTPRALLQASTADPAQGYVLVYGLADDAAAEAAARELASYLGSGFGQTNFPTDAQFHVAHRRDTVVFTWWSRERSADAASAEAAYDAISSVGTEEPVVK